MPNPKKFRSKKKFVSKCIPTAKEEGKPQDQAVAMCLNMWKNKNESFLEYYNNQEEGVHKPAYNYANKAIQILKTDLDTHYDKAEGGVEMRDIAPRLLITELGTKSGLDSYNHTIYLPILTEAQTNFHIKMLSIFLYKMAIQKFKKESALRDWLVAEYTKYYEGSEQNN